MFCFKKKEVYDFIVSMGGACSCTTLLRKCKLQDFSYPYDWIGGIPLKGRIELMLSGFKDWFHIEDFVKTGSRLNPEPCDIYKNTKTDLLYVHDFPLNIPIEESFESVKNKYDRRIKRMLDNINNAQRVCLVYIEPNESDNVYTMEYLKECYKILKEAYPDKVFKIKYIYSSKEEPLTEHEEGVDLYRLDYSSHEIEPPPGYVNMKVLKSCFKNVKLKRKFTLKKLMDFIFSYRVSKRDYTTKITVTIFGISFQKKYKKTVESKDNA